MKICRDCKILKNIEEFYKHPLSKDGRKTICKICHNIYVSKWRNENRHKTPAYSRTSGLKSRYGINDKDYDEMVKRQQGKCLICNEEPKKTKAFQTWNLHVDHCHVRGKVRGLLCHLCNRGLGLFREDINLLKKAVKYLKEHD